jgi:ATP-dependent protease HslVU (ClpYQ) ATPase subunit
MDIPDMKKTVIMLIGPKGSGKTHIGLVLEKKTDIPFLRVEPIWLSLPAGQDGWCEVKRAIHDHLVENDMVIIESLGISDGFKRLHHNIEQKYAIKYVRIMASPETCLERVRNRSKSDHIHVSEEEIEQYNRIAVQVNLPWELEILNDPPLSEVEIIALISRIRQDDAADSPTNGVNP